MMLMMMMMRRRNKTLEDGNTRPLYISFILVDAPSSTISQSPERLTECRRDVHVRSLAVLVPSASQNTAYILTIVQPGMNSKHTKLALYFKVPERINAKAG